MMTVLTQCPICQEQSKIEVEQGDYYAWRDGNMLIQDAMPTLSATKREQLKTGICGPCWDRSFGEE